MAQSAESAITWAVRSIRSMVSMVAVRSSTCSMSTASWPRPTRQGTHLPQVWAWHSRRKFRDMSTGHRPGWLALMRRPMSRYRSFSTVWARSGISMDRRLNGFPSSFTIIWRLSVLTKIRSKCAPALISMIPPEDSTVNLFFRKSRAGVFPSGPGNKKSAPRTRCAAQKIFRRCFRNRPPAGLRMPHRSGCPAPGRCPSRRSRTPAPPSPPRGRTVPPSRRCWRSSRWPSPG